MAGIPINPDLPTSYMVPGVYGFISLQGSGPTPVSRRVLFLGYKTSAGTAQAAAVVRVNNEDDVVSAAGKGSDLHRMFRAFKSQGVSGAELWLCPMNAPSGTAQTRKITIIATPTDATTLGVNTTASSAGVVTAWICGYRFDATVANGDSFAVIAANLNAQIQTMVDYLPCTASVSTDTITLTARHAALTSADLPVMVAFSTTAMAVSASPGTLVTATNAVADGTATVSVATQSASSSFANTDTAAAIARGLSTAVNAATAFPVTSCNPTGTTITLFYINERVFNWAATAITAAATTTISPSWGNNAAGLPSSSTPSLATALTGISNQEGFRLWLTNFTGQGSYITDATYTQTGSATSYTSLGSISTFIEQQANGKNCKGQVVLFGDTRGLATSGAVPVGTSPALTASPRYIESWCAASPQQGYEISARLLAYIVQQDYLPKNLAGAILTSDGTVPLLIPHRATRPSDDDVNSAMASYYMTPVRANALNQLEIVAGRTTAKPSATIAIYYIYPGQIFTVDYFRDDLRNYLWGLFRGLNLKPNGTPVTSNVTTPEAIRDQVVARLFFWDGLDFFDGAERVRDLVVAQQNPSLPSRVDISVPVAIPPPIEQLSNYFQLAG